MRLQARFWLTLAGLVLLVGVLLGAWGALLWAQLEASERAALAAILAQRPLYPLVLVVLLLAGLGPVLGGFFRSYPREALHIAEGTQLIRGANPAFRLATGGAAEMRAVAEQINALAEQHQQLHRELEARVEAARAALAEERNRLAALVADLAEGVVVCSEEGRILLYNQRARQILEAADPAGDGGPAGGLVGLGRSLYGIFDPQPIQHALETLRHRPEQDTRAPIARFVTHTRAGQLLRLHLTPVLDAAAERSGFVLTLEDVTRRIEGERQRDALLRTLVERVRASLGNIRAAIETIAAFPTMEPEQLHRFQGIIQDEATGLSDHLDATLARHADHLKGGGPLEEMLASDLLAALERSFATRTGMEVRARHAGDAVWLRVDSYALVLALTRLIRRLQEEEAVEEVTLELGRAGRLARLDLIWSGPLLDPDTLRRWREEPLAAEGWAASLTLQEVIERHGGAAWSQFDRTTGRSYFRMFLPLTEPEGVRQLRVASGSRPEFYDFDLAARSPQSAELERAPLTELTYTVFDTETTGLNPSEGDELIALGAVRIVNGRLLREEIFDQRVNPGRPISPESVAVHGITREMLRDEPPLELVLPRFARFAEDTVLVAHNAAFDMRFLQLAEVHTGVRFRQPVLDTLLLSLVVQPEQEDHSLDAIAARLGISTLGRHTSLGDALLTGQIFLRLLPLLAAQGITTLGEAQEASRDTLLARLKY